MGRRHSKSRQCRLLLETLFYVIYLTVTFAPAIVASSNLRTLGSQQKKSADADFFLLSEAGNYRFPTPSQALAKFT
jgi:hypothetical protein